ncbi:hypothetical protein E1262_28005 [Jiangella aurantiaca]|uniref:Uncharacterized protein n=1 Tax=Jiangella aurantiaca TaxID=2530373 RepID=A0A4R5A1K7_9ACTN|nr:hypothetical protein [Jiangella aurantiaca]TDD64494.1 hypothetical protein E1262_28005 [Jiangella aurantiaca]
MFETWAVARGRRPDPDKILAAKLDASARRAAFDGATPDDAASELRALADGRVDILTQVAGHMAGLWSARARYDGGIALIAAGFLVRAVGTEEMDLELADWVEEGRFAARRTERDAAALAELYGRQRRNVTR